MSILSENLEDMSQNDPQILQNFLRDRVFGKFQIEFFFEKIEFLAFLVNRVFAKMLKKKPCRVAYLVKYENGFLPDVGPGGRQ